MAFEADGEPVIPSRVRKIMAYDIPVVRLAAALVLLSPASAIAQSSINMFCGEAWPGRDPNTEDEFVQAIEAGKKSKPMEGAPPDICLDMILSELALFLEKKYPDQSEAQRHWDAIIKEAGLE